MKPDAALADDAVPDWPDRRLQRARVDTAGTSVASVECLIEEIPVALVYNGISHAVMLATPSDLEDFGHGFSLSEGIVASADEIFDCEAVAVEQGVELRMEIAGERLQHLKARRRQLAGRTGCGLCGIESLQAAMPSPEPVPARPPLTVSAIRRALKKLNAHQKLHRVTGAAHAAAWASRDGDIVLVREDVGRHNALDKLIGAMASAQGPAPDLADGFVLVTSRASVEMVQKVARAGIGLLAAISAPTAMATRYAEEAGVTLVAHLRRERLTCYSRPDGLIND
ncbi:formate dehydrogenase accessory sulfurtransferase FdhD [Nitrogeniibacter mangrovi]|uniref:Sulfur carrier protein FdhD n=1 Tax=Nitrogeniibacter mangrovi TaxID=2016596 RepID=A0A6C1B8I9_9RHOO|nr:formate dehydrogenase accessory sulfurtransferase FdhD [Nitrogeniibacter mangrovi]